MKRSHCLFLWLMLIGHCVYGAISFSTARLQAIASFLALPGIDTLTVGNHDHYSYRSHPLAIRINTWGEVEHIGLLLFKEEMKVKRELPIYDFLERYLLERNLSEDTENATRFGFDPITFEEGTYTNAFLIDGTERFDMCYLAHKAYQVRWEKEGSPLLAMRFEMDYQLLSGCGTIELEQNYLRKLSRYRAKADTTRSPKEEFPKQGKSYTKQGSRFMGALIGNDLFYQKEEQEWTLITGSQQVSKSIANTMLSRDTEGNYELAITLDRYGYKEAKDTVRLYDWLSLCEEEGCKPYFGIKEKKDSVYTGSLFMVNETCGYVHLLSVNFPISALDAQKGIIEGRLFIYIPLHNVSDQMFINTYNRQKEYEKTDSSDNGSPTAGDPPDGERPTRRGVKKGD